MGTSRGQEAGMPATMGQRAWGFLPFVHSMGLEPASRLKSEAGRRRWARVLRAWGGRRPCCWAGGPPAGGAERCSRCRKGRKWCPTLACVPRRVAAQGACGEAGQREGLLQGRGGGSEGAGDTVTAGGRGCGPRSWALTEVTRGPMGVTWKGRTFISTPGPGRGAEATGAGSGWRADRVGGAGPPETGGQGASTSVSRAVHGTWFPGRTSTT